MTVMNIIELLAGLGLFLFGMKLLGEGLEKAAGNRLKNLLGMVTKNRVLAVFAGALITALIQSSSATTVMVVGFVNAGMMSLTQAVGVIMGANVGTTVTSLMLSVKLDFGTILCCAGLILSNLPGKKLKGFHQIGSIAMGLGILFIGMDTMSSSMAPLRTWEGFRTAMVSISNPIAGVLIGALITAVLQSSSASVGILQALAGEGLIPLQTCMFILFGQNIGTCVTALLSTSGANTTAKRTAMVHLLFNVIGTLLFTILTVVLPLDVWISDFASGNLRLQIALTHVLFNMVTTALLLPMASVLERAACLMVREKDARKDAMRLKYFDRRLLKTPPIAVSQLFNEVLRMGEIAKRNYLDAVRCFNEWNDETAESVRLNEDVLDFLNSEITRCLVEVKGLDLNDNDTRLVGSLFHVVNDFERIGDHSMNILEAAQTKQNDEVHFAAKVVGELDTLGDKVITQIERAIGLFKSQSTDETAIGVVEEAEAEIDAMTDALRTHHVDRLKNKKCSARNGMLYLEMLTNLERVADHAENIATSVDKETPVNAWN